MPRDADIYAPAILRRCKAGSAIAATVLTPSPTPLVVQHLWEAMEQSAIKRLMTPRFTLGPIAADATIRRSHSSDARGAPLQRSSSVGFLSPAKTNAHKKVQDLGARTLRDWFSWQQTHEDDAHHDDARPSPSNRCTGRGRTPYETEHGPPR